LKTIEIGKTGRSVGQVALGAMVMGTTVDEKTSFEMLDRFLDLGGNHIDTANCYAWWVGHGEYVGNESEELLGRWMKLRGNRDRVFLATKVGARIVDGAQYRDSAGDPIWGEVDGYREHQTAETIKRGVEASLRRLQSDYIDLYYSHIEDRTVPLEETLGALNDLVAEGKVRLLGCSNYRTWRIERARAICDANGWTGFSTVQQQCSYLRPKAGSDLGIALNMDDELLDYLSLNPSLTLVGYSPLLKGIYDDERKRVGYYNWNLFDNDDSRARLECLTATAAELGVKNSQLVIAWLLHKRPAMIPLLAATNLAQFESNFAAASISLTSEQVQRLDSAGA
jgi:aryl-alcohol dehydrogenase-like predicted oxidoreductase